MIASRCLLLLLLCAASLPATAQSKAGTALPTPRESLDRVAGFSMPLPETVGALKVEDRYLMTKLVTDGKSTPREPAPPQRKTSTDEVQEEAEEFRIRVRRSREPNESGQQPDQADPSWAAELKQVQAQLQRLQKTLGDGHPIVRQLQDRARFIMQRKTEGRPTSAKQRAAELQLHALVRSLGPNHPKVQAAQKKLAAMAGSEAANRKSKPRKQTSESERQIGPAEQLLIEKMQKQFAETIQQQRAALERMHRQNAEQKREAESRVQKAREQAEEAIARTKEAVARAQDARERDVQERHERAEREERERRHHEKEREHHERERREHEEREHHERERREHEERERHERAEHEEREHHARERREHEEREHHERERREHEERERHERAEHEERERRHHEEREHHERERREHEERERHERAEHEERERRHHEDREHHEHERKRREREEREEREHHEREHDEHEMARERMHVLRESAERMADLGMGDLAEQLHLHAEEIEQQFRQQHERRQEELVHEVFRRLDQLQDAVMGLHHRMDRLTEQIGHGPGRGDRHSAGRGRHDERRSPSRR